MPLSHFDPVNNHDKAHCFTKLDFISILTLICGWLHICDKWIFAHFSSGIVSHNNGGDKTFGSEESTPDVKVKDWDGVLASIFL